MPLQSTNSESYRFSPSALLSLFALDTRYIAAGGQIYYFHAGVNGLYRPVVFNGIEYTPFPLEFDEFATNGNGSPPRPKLRASNINGFMSQFLLTEGDLCGARLTRIRVYARFIDNSNFAAGINPFGTPDPSAAYEPDVFFVNRKVTENPQLVELECTSPFEIDNVQLPRRPILATVCPIVYRDPETCGYSGPPVSDRFGKLFTAAAPDGYGYTLSDKGIWSDAVSYQVGDYVTIISQGDFTNGEIFVYVCSTANTGYANNPQFNPSNWISDACPHNLLGCRAHYPLPQQLSFGGFLGAARASFVN